MNAIVEFQREPSSLPMELTRIERALAVASTPAEVNQVIALMDAAVAYAKRFYKDQQDVILRAKTLRYQAERRLGEMLSAMPKATGLLKRGPVVPLENHGESTLAELGIDKKTSMRAQRLAALTPERFDAVASGAIPISEVLKPLPKNSVAARTREQQHQHKVIVATEGSTPLIAAMRMAHREVTSATEPIAEQEKAVAMARKLAAALGEFIARFDGASVDR